MRDAGRTVGELGAAYELPGVDDVYTFVPDPDGRPEAVRVLAHARRVRRRNLWVWYWLSNAEVQVLHRSRQHAHHHPPVHGDSGNGGGPSVGRTSFPGLFVSGRGT